MTSVDGSVIFAALVQRGVHHTLAVEPLRDAGADGPLFVASVVFAELMASRRPAAILDFRIAAHAAHHGLRVLTFDRIVDDSMFAHLLVTSGCPDQPPVIGPVGT